MLGKSPRCRVTPAGSSIFSGISGAQRWTSAPAFAAAEASPGTDRAGPPVSGLRLATVWRMRISGMVRKDLGESVAEGILAKSCGAVVVKLLAVPRRGGENFVDGGGDFLVAFGINQGAERAISKSIDRAVAIAGDDRESGGGGFEKDNAEAFFFTRKSEEIGATIEIGKGFVRDEAGEAAVTGNAKIRCDFFDVSKVVALAPEHPMELGVLLDELGHELQEAMVAFA